MDTELERYLDYCKRKVQEAMKPVLSWKESANRAAEAAGEEKPYPDIDSGETVIEIPIKIRADQFADFRSPSTAARAYLASRTKEKGAATLDEIFDALKCGGFGFSSEKDSVAKGGLKIALGKDGEIRRLDNDTFGLWDWYPSAKRSVEKAITEVVNGADPKKVVEKLIDESDLGSAEKSNRDDTEGKNQD